MTVFTAALLLVTGMSYADDQAQDVSGPLLSREESEQFNERMRNAKDSAERRQIQEEQHNLVQERAKARNESQRKMHEQRRQEHEKGKGSGDGDATGGGKGKGKN